MGTLTKIEPKSVVRTQSNNIPSIGQAQDLQDGLSAMSDAWSKIWKAALQSDQREFDEAKAEAAQLLTSGRLSELQEELQIWAAPASPKQISTMLAGLIGSFPHGQPPQPEIFARTLLEDVVSMRPSIYAVESMCRNLRRSQKFLPAISEALEALKAAEERVGPQLKLMAGFEKHIDFCTSKFRSYP